MNPTYDLSGKRVLVAGHRGMVGSALVRRLASEDCTVLTLGRDTVDLRRQAAVEVGILNRSNPWIWWQVIGRAIVQTATVETMPFAPHHLMTTMAVFLDAMTTRDDLALRVGGEVA